MEKDGINKHTSLRFRHYDNCYSVDPPESNKNVENCKRTSLPRPEVDYNGKFFKEQVLKCNKMLRVIYIGKHTSLLNQSMNYHG